MMCMYGSGYTRSKMCVRKAEGRRQRLRFFSYLLVFARDQTQVVRLALPRQNMPYVLNHLLDLLLNLKMFKVLFLQIHLEVNSVL